MTARRSPRVRLILMSLEERRVPANLVVTDPGDNGGVSQLRAMWNTANTNGEADTITFSGSVTSISLLSVLNTYSEAQNLTITGNGKTVTTINAPAGNRIFDLNVPASQPSITITDIQLKGGSSSGNGGAILDDNETLVLTNVSFTQNIATVGGAVATTVGPVTMTVTGCDFTLNSAGPAAGAIKSHGTLSVVSSTFSGNTASGITGGGAIYCSTATFTSCTFTNNTAQGLGGAIRTPFPATMSVANSTFSGNTSASAGAAVHGGGSTTVAMSTFTNNSSSFSGGAIGMGGSVTLTLDQCMLTGNSALNNGGAVYSYSSVDAKLCVFSNNKASNAAGALRTGSNSTVSFCDFSFNTASLSTGGAITGIGAGATLTVSNSTFRNNSAFGSGGAIFSNLNNVTINQCTFNKNTSSGANGGGALAMANNTMTINNSTIYDNTANGSLTTSSGAGIVRNVSGTSVLVINSSIIAGNKITGSGNKGIDLYSNATVTIAGNNSLIGTNDNSSVTFTGTIQAGTNAAKIDPLLNSLADNGGTVLPDGNVIKTTSLKGGSPALNLGNNTVGFSNDQRGLGYARSVGGKTDVGAFQTLPPPPTATVTFGDGTNQRSMVKQIVVTFSESVNFSPNVVSSFTLTRTGTGGTPTNVTLTANPVSGPASSVTITFSGSLTENGSLVDGFYDFKISAGVVSGAGGALDGNNDTIPGGSYSVTGTTANKFFRLFGDSDGDATTTLADFAAFRGVFNLGANPIFDFDNSGNVDLGDFAQFRARFNLSP